MFTMTFLQKRREEIQITVDYLKHYVVTTVAGDGTYGLLNGEAKNCKFGIDGCMLLGMELP